MFCVLTYRCRVRSWNLTQKGSALLPVAAFQSIFLRGEVRSRIAHLVSLTCFQGLRRVAFVIPSSRVIWSEFEKETDSTNSCKTLHARARHIARCIGSRWVGPLTYSKEVGWGNFQRKVSGKGLARFVLSPFAYEHGIACERLHDSGVAGARRVRRSRSGSPVEGSSNFRTSTGRNSRRAWLTSS